MIYEETFIYYLISLNDFAICFMSSIIIRSMNVSKKNLVKTQVHKNRNAPSENR